MAVLSPEVVQNCSAQLLAALLAHLGHEDSKECSTTVPSHFIRVRSPQAINEVTRDVKVVDRWMAMQLCVWYVNLAVTAVSPDDHNALLSTRYLRRI